MGTLSAQNAFFLPFGQTDQEVIQLISQKEYPFELTQGADSISQEMQNGQRVTYYFKNGTLYAIEDTRIYTDKKEADRVLKTITDYMENEDRRVRHVGSSGGRSHYLTIEQDRVIEVVAEVRTIKTRKGKVKDKHKEVTMHLRVTSRLHGPRLQTEEYVSEVLRKGS